MIDPGEALEAVCGDRASRDLVALAGVGDKGVFDETDRLEIAELTAELDDDAQKFVGGFEAGKRFGESRVEGAVVPMCR
jgi:hypothetical protein